LGAKRPLLTRTAEAKGINRPVNEASFAHGGAKLVPK
jgi:hypothetical protein